MRRVSWVIALVVLSLPGNGAAQSSSGMRGLTDVKLVIEGLDSAAAECNVTTGGLDAAVRVPLDDSRLRVREESPDRSYLYVNAKVLNPSDGLCAARIDLELNRIVIVQSSGEIHLGATVWNNGGAMTGPTHDFGQRVNAMLRELTNLFLAEWIKQNPKPEAP